MAYPCEIDECLIVPYVQLFPLEVDILQQVSSSSTSSSSMVRLDEDDMCGDDDSSVLSSETETRTLILVTDCHPRVLSRTTVGASEDGAVMYIGPDSLALVQHLPIQEHLKRKYRHQYHHDVERLEEEEEGGKFANENSPNRILDFCTGSGIQALSTLVSLERMDPNAIAVCVDYNERALRFTKFNALLNGIDAERVHLIRADLISGDLLPLRQEVDIVEETKSVEGIENENNIMDVLMSIGEVDGKSKISLLYDVILANPPFIPVPGNCTIKDDGDSNIDTNIRGNISRRYGLFSSGGSSGEEVLQSIVSMSSRLLRPNDGVLAIGKAILSFFSLSASV